LYPHLTNSLASYPDKSPLSRNKKVLTQVRTREMSKKPW